MSEGKSKARLPGVYCHYCGSENDGYTAVAEDARPKDGDALLCAYCGRMSILVAPEDGPLTTRPPEPMEELRFTDKIPQFMSLVAIAYDRGVERGKRDAVAAVDKTGYVYVARAVRSALGMKI